MEMRWGAGGGRQEFESSDEQDNIDMEELEMKARQM
jgi:hypothetical protein